MHRSRWLAIPFFLAAIALAGCKGGPSRRTLASAEPALSPPIDEGSTTVVSASPSQGTTFVDRHPLLFKPREYYTQSGNNPLVKSAAAVVVGVPAGILGELKQIVVGAPTEPRY